MSLQFVFSMVYLPRCMFMLVSASLLLSSTAYADNQTVDNISTQTESAGSAAEVFKNTLTTELATREIKEADVIHARMLAIATPRIYFSTDLSFAIDQPAQENFSIEVFEVTSVPPLEVKLGEQYEYQLELASTKPQRIEVGLIEAPEGMFVTLSGYVGWHPTDAQMGESVVTLFVEGADGTRRLQEFVVNVVENPYKGIHPR
ncbi:MAG: hypothetical protein JKY67_15615 [Pseudomonadales bacterium]|nr:hypothetical protein [Pseudomonadales bacterium]